MNTQIKPQILTYTVQRHSHFGLEIWVLVTFCGGDYCDERTFMSREMAITEGMRWVSQGQ